MSNQNALPRGNACLNCRKKKQRCDGTKPACHSCIKTNKECVYNEPPKSRAQLLVERISELENKIGQLESDSSSGGSQHSDSPPRQKDSPPQMSRYSSSQTPVDSRNGSPSSRSSGGSRIPGGEYYSIYAHRFEPAANTPAPRVVQSTCYGIMRPLNRDKCCFDLHVGRFIASLSYPSTDNRAPHPALVQSILLMGCYFSRSPALADYEVRFLAQSRQELSVSFGGVDRLHDYVRASNLVAFFYFCKGMYAEAYQQINQSVNVAVSCGLHQIASPVWRPAPHPQELEQFLSHPVDNVDLGERIHTFWQTVTLDRVIAMVVGHPSHLPNGPHADPTCQITTPWPRLIQEYESGNVSDAENNSVPHLFDTRLARYIRPETLYGLRAQGLCIAHFAFHLSHTPATPQEMALLDNAICTFIKVLPGLRNGGELGEIPPTPGLSPVNHKLVLIRTLPFLAHLILFQHGADSTARQRVGMATQGIVAIISELSDGDYSEVFLGLGHLWFIACDIMTNIFHHSTGPVRDQISRDLNIVMRALKKLSLVYPLLGFQVQELEQKLTAGPQA
ncbi:hypothetical protein M407DRAFT_4494 [Tulasnella calospora MUT 4182]|uniref:Zn(2)-C6 fungal-type domain-containing protein n=1 Tax=Tulasnella calospora MUT 4182 TaxID=1051891 RepID=A0A0C3MFN8_9AGAM|nr:hypothetical protein M407DRAFT_4494 [Tulasnella calospora MUT 4182]